MGKYYQKINQEINQTSLYANRSWDSPLYLVSLGLLLFLFVSGAISFFWETGSFFVQFNVLFHTLIGIPAGGLISLFYIRHWLRHRNFMRPMDSKVGHFTGQFVLFSFLSGILLIFIGISGSASLIYWAHILVSVLFLAFLGFHLWIPTGNMVRRRLIGAGSGLLKSSVFLILFLAVTAFGSWTYLHEEPTYIVKNDYAYPFGSNPFSPSMTTTPGNQFINENTMAGSDGCGQENCHPDIHEQWSESVHRFSTDNIYFKHTLEYMAETEGADATRYCGGCHDPLALLSGKMDSKGTIRNDHPDEGISCIVCHSIEDSGDLEGTGKYVYNPPERYLFWDREGEIPSFLNYLLIRLKPEHHKQTFMKPFYTTSEYCAVCHKQSIDEMTNDYRWLRLQDQYDPWQESGFSGESVLAYRQEEVQTCNGCHMREVESKDPSGSGGKVKSHRYIAANTAIPFIRGYDSQLAQTKEWLQRDELIVDIVAMKQSGSSNSVIKPLHEKMPISILNKSVIIDVSVTNNIAHSFPTGPLDLYEAWLEFIVADGEGKEIYASGKIDESGHVDSFAHQFIAPPITEDGNWIQKHDLWNDRTILFNRSIPAQASDVIHYKIDLPELTKPPITLSARVRYRRFNRWYTEWVLGRDAPEFPIVDLCADTLVFSTSPETFIHHSNDHLRLNRYGIGLFRQERYAESIDAFQEAINLKNDYTEAYINAAMANLNEGFLGRAEAWIDKAINVDSSSLRAKAYLGMIKQRQGRFGEAETYLSRVLAAYPKDRKIL
ncbi:MAG: hypothetical protein ISR89_06240, partial [Candidatus Marinimicrobia bacterium]|nr:hypothetical protein [Candidatus Neomarinimicrobiota bacterium]